MSITSAYALPHPPLAVPAVGRGQEEKIPKTIEAMEKAARHLWLSRPDTIVFITAHGTVYSDFFHISPGKGARGDFVRFGAKDSAYETEYDEALAFEVASQAAALDVPAGMQGEKSKELDHGFLVPLHFIQRQNSEFKTLRISVSGLDAFAHYNLGRAIAKAAKALGRKIAIVASGDLSHKLSKDGPYGFHPDGPVFDEKVMQALKSGEFLKLLMLPSRLRANAAECGCNSFIVMAGCLDKTDARAEIVSYECPFGVGYGVVGYACEERNESRDFLSQYSAHLTDISNKARKGEDPYRRLARLSLEHRLRSGKALRAREAGFDIPNELTSRKAGTFVSLHKNGELRGCIGTIAPTTDSIAEEIMRNAVAAGLNDNRFPPVSHDELPMLTYKVDVLEAPEDIEGPEELDVRMYGVIVEDGYKRGLLLPNLEGIDTVEQQVSIAKSKAGIGLSEPVKLKRFKVTRYG